MSTQTENMSPQESLDLIQHMIRQTKASFVQISYYFLMWGILLSLAGISEYVLQYVVNYQHHYIGWPIAGVLGGILAALHGNRSSEEPRHFSGRLIGFLWGGFGLTLLVFLVCTSGTGVEPGPYIILLTGLPTFVSGGIMRFRPLMIGGVLFWIFGIITFFFLPEYRSLLFSLAIITGYIIPGLMLRRAEQNRKITPQ